jgi:tRNA nucleotidyltransferase (CCA-adding enzyme)
MRKLPRATHELLRAVGVLSRDMGCSAYLVGGIVRDLVIGHGNMDLDIAIEGDAERLARAFAKKTGSLFRGPTSFGTCKVESKAFGKVDIATARRETYRHPGALPTVHPSGMEDDLARRDFTMNAMAISLNPVTYGGLYDPMGGLADISRRTLSIMHDESFTDDPTRILRGIRFAARYGFTFEGKTLRLLRDCVGGSCLRSISGKRVFSELNLICQEVRAGQGLGLLRRYEILEAIDPALEWDDMRIRHSRNLKGALRIIRGLAGPGLVREWLCWFSVLFVGLGKRRSGRMTAYFNLPRDVKVVCSWVGCDLEPAGSRLSQLDMSHAYEVTKHMNLIPPEALAHLYVMAGRRERRLARKYLREWRHVKPFLTGGRISALGAGEGPLVGSIFQNILKLKLEGRLVTAQDEIDYVKTQLRTKGVRS